MLTIGFDVRRSVVIDKPAEAVYRTVGDFGTWRDWSPWLSQEPDCPVEITGAPGQAGHRQSWNGKKIGSGHMEMTRADDGRRLDYDLFFVKPWKSHAAVAFTFGREGDGTRVTWSMDGSLPLLMFFMKKRMAAMVGKDYERGLAMLKALLETGS